VARRDMTSPIEIDNISAIAGDLPFSTTSHSGWMTLQKNRVGSYESCSEYNVLVRRGFIAEGLLVVT
jgi:hypothetical protein